jgi:hypothetical protein
MSNLFLLLGDGDEIKKKLWTLKLEGFNLLKISISQL